MEMSLSSLCALGFQPLRKIPQMNYSILQVNHVRIWKTMIDALITQVNCIFRYQLDNLFGDITKKQLVGSSEGHSRSGMRFQLWLFEQR